MDSTVIQANKALEKAVTELQGQMAIMDTKLKLCLQVISEFGHFVPSIIEDFKYEMKKLDADGEVVGKEGDDQMEDEEPTIYTNLNIDDITASDN